MIYIYMCVCDDDVMDNVTLCLSQFSDFTGARH